MCLKKILEKLEGLSNLRLSVELHCRSIAVITLEARKNTLRYIGAKFGYDGIKRITSNKQRWRAESLSVRHGIGALPLIDPTSSTFVILVFLEDKKGQKTSRVSFRDNNWQRSDGKHIFINFRFAHHASVLRSGQKLPEAKVRE